jgi:hypothetical protein
MMGGPPKLSKAAKLLFGSSPLKATRDSNDAADVEASPLAAPPLMSVEPPSVDPKVSGSGSRHLPGLDVSDLEAESDEGVGGHIDMSSPMRGTGARDVAIAERDLSPHKLRVARVALHGRHLHRAVAAKRHLPRRMITKKRPCMSA